MLVGIHTNPSFGFFETLQRYEHILDYNGIEHIRLDSNEPDFWDRVAKVDLFIFHWDATARQHQQAPTILGIVEKELGVKCFPNQRTYWAYDDKVREYYLLKQHGFPVVPTWVFWTKEAALQWLEDEAEFPLVFKLKGSSGSRNVVLVKKKSQAVSLTKKMFSSGILTDQIPDWNSLQWRDYNIMKGIGQLARGIRTRVQEGEGNPYEQFHMNYVLFQQFLSGNTYDTRISVLGKRAFGARRFVRDNDFRASGSGKIDFNRETIDLGMVRLALEVSEKLGFQSMGYDFLYDQNRRPMIGEMSYTFPDHVTAECEGYWDEQLRWHGGHFWFQYFVLMDALECPDLRQPEMPIKHEMR